MSLEAMTWAMRSRPRTATEKLVLLSLADHHNQSNGRCDPSINRIADESLCSPRQAMRCIESLAVQGLIRPVKTTGKRSSYRLEMNVTRDTHVTSDAGDTRDTHVTTTRDTHVTGPVTPMSPEPGTNQEDKPGRGDHSGEPLLAPPPSGKPNGPPPCPHQQIIDLYHEVLPELPAVKVWTDKRRKMLGARWREDRKRQSLTYWRRFFAFVACSDFLTGRLPPNPGRAPWRASLDWLINAENFVKVIEEKFPPDDTTRLDELDAMRESGEIQ